MVSGLVPDLHHFCNRGAKDVVPLYRDSAASDPNILPGLLALLSSTYGTVVTPTAWASYLYGVLAQPAFTSQFYQQLNKKELHIPITKDYQLFSQAQQFGARLIWLHTYGERMVPEGRAAGDLPQGQARCTSAVASDPANYPNSYEYNETTQTLHIGDGQFAPVAPDIYHFNISGLNVVQSWLNNRMQERKGRKSSPLDDIRPHRWSNQFTSELLELLWVLEHSIANYPAQAELLQAIIAGPCFQTSELPAVPEDYRKAPKPPAQSDQTSMDI